MNKIEQLPVIIENWQKESRRFYDVQFEYVQLRVANKDFYKEMTVKWFTNKDLGDISYRTIGYWGEMGYLTGEKNEQGKWRKFDFIQLIWIYLLDNLRKLGVSIEEVVPAIFMALGFIPFNDEDERQKIIDATPDNLKRKLDGMLGNHITFQEIFRFYVLYTALSKKQISIRYYSDGFAKIIKGVSINSSQQEIIDYLDSSNGTFISISINELLQRAIGYNNIERLEVMNIFSNNEIELLNHLRKKDVSKVTIKLENGNPTMLEVTERFSNEELNKRVYEYLTQPYQEITFKTNGGKTAFFERETIIKLK